MLRAPSSHSFSVAFVRKADEARELLAKCMEVLFYRDCRTINRIQIASVTAEGVNVGEPFAVDTKWNYDSFVKPKAGADQGGSW